MAGSPDIRAYWQQTLTKRLEQKNMSLHAFSTDETLLETLRNRWGIIKGTGRTVCSYISSLSLLATEFSILIFLNDT